MIPMPSLKREEIQQALAKISDDKVQHLEDSINREYFSSRSTGAEMYQEAIRLGWLLGPF